ncbi:MAG: hypothetical protein K8F91_17150 [Candidatus Obscuribacterales bacterium]|nr:hypothetical protein [Candidatus Obscuribacterales bacterium]
MSTTHPQFTLELDSSFRNILDKYRQEWINLPDRNRPANRHQLTACVERIYLDTGQKKPVVIWCDSVFQLATLPLIVALNLDPVAREQIIPILRADLTDGPWPHLWKNLDQNLKEEFIEPLIGRSDKQSQKNCQKEVNRFIARVHEVVGSTFDTTEAPRLSAIGLQINSKYVAEVQGLMALLDKELTQIVSSDCISEIKTELSSISAVYSSMENQLALQVIPQILAQSVSRLRHALLDHHGNLTESLSQNPHHLNELIKLIYQADPDAPATGNNAVPLWQGARIGAYRDPAVRLIASTLQIDLFKQSSILGWLPLHFYMTSTIQDIYSADLTKKLRLWNGILNGAYASIFYDGICFLCDQPESLILDNERRYHGENGPALTFADGYKVYAWHGRGVPEEIIEKPELITIERIEKETNIEIRTILVERYGLSRFLKDTNARIIDQDQCGVLYRKDFQVEEPLCVVMVANATPEPDGTYKPYFLRVPPDRMTARSAVAWTFGLSTDDYLPVIET